MNLINSSVIVLDEVDQLDSRGQEILYTIFEWPALPKSKLLLIGECVCVAVYMSVMVTYRMNNVLVSSLHKRVTYCLLAVCMLMLVFINLCVRQRSAIIKSIFCMTFKCTTGIANALDLTDRVLPRLQSHSKCRPQLLHFPPYTKDQIATILQVID